MLGVMLVLPLGVVDLVLLVEIVLGMRVVR